MLSEINSHPKDSKISFEEEGHLYTIEGMDGHPISVTTVIHKFFHVFDADKIISKMMNGRNWANSKYNGMTPEEIKQQWKKNGEDASRLGTAMHKAIEDYINDEATNPPEEENYDAITSHLFQNFTITLPTIEEIKKVTWDHKIPTVEEQHIIVCPEDGEVPTVEEQCNWICPVVPDIATQTIEFGFFLKFWKELKIGSPNFRAYRTEWLVYDIEKRLAGSIDLTITNEKGEIIICDWKRSKEIRKSNLYEKGLKIFSHLDDCNYNHYSLQLNIYRHILETHYDKKVIGLFLIVLHPNNENYIFIQVPKLEKEIADLWNMLPIANDH